MLEKRLRESGNEPVDMLKKLSEDLPVEDNEALENLKVRTSKVAVETRIFSYKFQLIEKHFYKCTNR